MVLLVPIGMVGALGIGLAGWSAFVARAAEERVPADGGCIDLPGARIHYVDLGAREEGVPTIVLVHGLMGQLRNFTYALAERLSAHARVILVDRPGWGWSSVDGPRPGIARQAEILAELIAALKLDRPLLVGHSLGGAIALALAAEHPELVRGLALIAPLTQPVDRPPPAFAGLMAPSLLRPLLAWTVAVPAGMANSRRVAAQIFAPDPVPDDFAIRGGGALAIRPRSYLAGSFELSTARAEMAALAPRYPGMTLPVSILFGRDDAVLDAAVHGERTAATLPNATLALVDGGHMLPVAHPDRTAEWLLAQL